MRPGDLIQRPILVGGRYRLPAWHYGVLVAPNVVVHLTLERGVEAISLAAFAAEWPVLVARRPRDPARAIGRAWSRVGERGTFHLIWHNCGTFASWCGSDR